MGTIAKTKVKYRFPNLVVRMNERLLTQYVINAALQQVKKYELTQESFQEQIQYLNLITEKTK